jgi:hypothetical protein
MMRARLRVDDRHIPLLGECTWWQGPVGLSVLGDLQARVPHLPGPYREAPRFVLFSASGFTEDLRAVAVEQSVTLDHCAENSLAEGHLLPGTPM